MPRPRKHRFVRNEPTTEVFQPRGPAAGLEAVELGLDELEALRLADLEGLYQDAAAERMKISRATFGRLVAEARRKVADALIHGKVLRIRGGDVKMAPGRGFGPGPGRGRRRHGGGPWGPGPGPPPPPPRDTDSEEPE